MSDLQPTEYQNKLLDQSLDKKGQKNFGDERGQGNGILDNATQADLNIIDANIEKKGVIESINSSPLPQLNYEPTTNFFDATNAYDIKESFNEKHPNKFSDLLNKASNGDVESINKLNLIEAYAKLNEKNVKSINEWFLRFREENPNISADVADRLFYEKSAKEIKSMFESEGVIKEELLDSPLFMANVDPITYRSLANSYNVAHDSWDWLSGWRGEKYRRVLDLQLNKGELTPEEYGILTEAVNARYTVKDESETLKTMGQIVSGMVQPYVDNWFLTLGILGATILTKGKGATVMWAAPSAIDLYQREQASQFYDIWKKNEDNKANGLPYKEKLDQSEIGRQTALSSLAQAGLEFGTDILTMKLLKPVSKIAGKGQSKITAKIFEILGRDKKIKKLIAESEEELAKKNFSGAIKLKTAELAATRDSYLNLFMKTLGLTAFNATAETGAEVAQNIVHDFTVNKISGEDYTAKQAYDTAKETVSSVGVPILALMALGHGTKLTADIAMLETRGRSQLNHIKGLAATINNSNTPLAQRDAVINGEIIDKLNSNDDNILYSRFYSTPQDIKNNLKKDGIDFDLLDEKTKNILTENGKADYESIHITEKQMSELPKNVKDSLVDIVTDKEGKLYTEEVRKLLSDEKLEEIAARFEEQEKFKNENRQPIDEFNKRVYNRLIENKVESKKAQRIADLYSAFLTSISEQTHIPVSEILKDYEPSFKGIKEQAPRELGVSETAKASFNKKTNEINFKEENDFESALHESTHFFLQTVLDLVKKGKLDKSFISNLNAWYGKDVSQIDINSKEYNALQEQFVAAFIHGLITGDVKLNNNPLFKNFKNFLVGLNGSDKFNSFTKQELNRGFEDTYGMESIDADTSFNQFINVLFTSEMQGEIARQDREPIQEIVSTVLNSESLSEEEKQQFKKNLESTGLSDESIQSELNQFILKMLLLNERDKGKVQEYLKEFYAKHKELQSDEMTEKIMRVLDDYHEFIDMAYEKNKNNPTEGEVFANYLRKAIGISKLDLRGMNITPQQKKRLADLGFKFSQKSGTFITPSQLFSWVKDNDYIKKHPEIQNGNDLINHLAALPTAKERAIIDAEVQFKEKLSDLNTESQQNVESKITSILKRRGDQILKAFHKLLKDTRELKVVKETIAKVARAEVYKTKYSDARVYGSQGSARNQAIKVNNELARGNVGQAYQHVQAMTYHTEKSKVISEVKGELAKTFIKVRQMIRRGDKKNAKNYDTDILKLNHLIAFKLGMVGEPKFDITNIDIESIKNTSNGLNTEVIDAAVDFISNDKLSNYKNMTLGDLLIVRDLMKAVTESARSAKVVELNGQQVAIEETVNKAKEALSSFKDKKAKFDVTDKGGSNAVRQKKTFWEKLKGGYRNFSYLTKLMEQFCQRIDGSVVGGVFHDMYQTVRDALSQRNVMMHRIIKRQVAALNKVKLKKRDSIECPEFEYSDEIKKATGATHLTLGTNEYKNRVEHEVLGILLHCGTNYKHFINSTFAGETFAEKESHFNSWLRHMIEEEIITPELMECCQEIWNINKEIEPLANRAAKQTKGYSFRVLEGRDFTLTFKNGNKVVYHGGYVPAIENKDITGSVYNDYDPTVSMDKNLSSMQKLAGVKNPSFTKERVSDEYGKPLSFDLQLLLSRTSDVLNYAYMMPAVVQVNKVLTNPELRAVMDEKFPDVYKQLFEPWLFSCATMTTQIGTRSPVLDTLLRFSRTIVSGLMMHNLNNSVQQIGNVPAIATYVDARYLLSNVHNGFFIATRKKQISEKSVFMKTRFAQTHDSLNTIQEEILTNAALYEDYWLKVKATGKHLNSFLNRHYYYVQKYCQDHIDVVAWQSAYEQMIDKTDIQLRKEFEGRVKLDELTGDIIALDGNPDTVKEYKARRDLYEKRSIEFADSVVRITQSSFDVSDISNISRGTAFQKLLATFGNYFYTMAQLTDTSVSIAVRRGNGYLEKTFMTLHALLMSLILPSIIAELVNQTLGTGNLLYVHKNDDETNEKIAMALALSPLKTRLSSYPVVGKIGQEVLDSWLLDNRARSDLISIPAVTTIEQMGTSYANALQACLGDGELKGKDIEGMLNSIATIYDKPVLFKINKAVGNAYDSLNGNLDYFNVDYKTLEFFRSSLGSRSEITKVK